MTIANALQGLHARLRREGLRANDIMVVRDGVSLREAVRKSRLGDRRLTPIIVFVGDELDDAPLAVGNVWLDPQSGTLRANGREEFVRPKPAAVLRVLMLEANRFVPRRTLIDRVWGGDRAGAEQTLRVYIHDLRALIEHDPRKPEHILTIRSGETGYLFRG